MLKILNETHVPEGTATKKLEQVVGQIVRTTTITFNEDELAPERTDHVKALHITVECRVMINSRVIIDNGCVLNVCPMKNLSKLASTAP